MALEDMGVTFVKLGQILATRADLLPPDYQAELAKLQDRARPLPAGTVEKAIQDELGAPPAELFGSFDTEPLAAASIGQAHAATLKDGFEVVVKVRRPGAVEQVEEDLAILAELAAVASRRWEIAEQYDVVGLAQEFEQTLTAELDYVREGRNAERFARNFVDHPDVHIPRVFQDTSTARVLTLERIHGVKIDDLAGLEAAGIDRHDLAERAARVVLKMVFEDGFFHADPHPGNFFIEDGGRIGLIDFGMVGSLDAPHPRATGPPTAWRHQRRLRAPGRHFPRARGGKAAGGPCQAERGFGPPAVPLLRATTGRDAAGPDARGEPGDHAPSPPAPSLQPGPAAEDGRHARVTWHRTGSPNFQMAQVLVPYAQRMMLLEFSPTVWARRLGAAGLEAARLGPTFHCSCAG